MNEVERLRRAEQARAIIDSPIWSEAWDNYRARCLSIMEMCDSNETELVMHTKRLLTAGAAARKHLEAAIIDGRIAADEIKLRKGQQ